MKCKYFMYMLLAVVLGACSSDEPAPPDSGHTGKSEFERIVKGRTWERQEVRYVDSRGNTFEYPMLLGYVCQLAGFRLNDGDCTYGGYYFMSPAKRSNLQWLYDEESGKLFFYLSTLSPNNEGYYIESVSEDEIVVHCDFGILPQWQYEMENGLEYYPEGYDEGSYARLLLKPLADEDADSFWARFQEK